MSTLAGLSGRRPGELAVTDGRRSLSWAELDERTVALAHGLESLGAAPGRHVAVVVGNRAEFVEAVIGAWRAGCAYTPVKTGWTAREVGQLLDTAGTAVVVTDRPAPAAAARERGVAVLDVTGDGFETWLDAQPRSPLTGTRCGYKLPFTSGTTGRPKAVLMSGSGATGFAEGWAALARYAELLDLPGDGVHLFCSRLFNGAPQTFGFGALARGAALRIQPEWDPAAALRALAAPDVTSTIMVPTMFRQLLALPGVDRGHRPAPGLRTLLHGGEPCPAALKRAMLAWFGPVLVEYYGFTEGGMTTITAADWLARPGSVGRPLPGLAVRILDADGQPVAPGVDGQVAFVAAAGRRFGYLGEPAQTEAAHRGDAFTVGDVGHLDEDGYLYLSGRSADVVLCAGVNVYPAEVEDALADVPGVADLCGAGVPDEERGEALVLLVTLDPGAQQAAVLARLQQAAAERLAPYKRPRRVEVVDELPRDATGKLLRAQVRERLADARH